MATWLILSIISPVYFWLHPSWSSLTCFFVVSILGVIPDLFLVFLTCSLSGSLESDTTREKFKSNRSPDPAISTFFPCLSFLLHLTCWESYQIPMRRITRGEQVRKEQVGGDTKGWNNKETSQVDQRWDASYGKVCWGDHPLILFCFAT